MPDFKFASIDAIPEELRSEAKQDGTNYVINLVSNKKLTEFRDNNIRFNQERDTAVARTKMYTDIVGEDVEKFKATWAELNATAQKVKDGALKGSDAVQKEVDARLEAATGTLRGQLKESAEKLAASDVASKEWKAKFERSVLHQQITNAVIAADSVANPQALPDILSRAEGLYHVQPDGSLVPKKGDVTIYGADGASPMTPKEWLTKLVAEAPYLGKASNGGGAAGNRNGGDTYGMSPEAFAALSPAERISRHRAAQKR